jgi:hypothetical protein
MILRTEGRHYIVAVLDAAGAVHYPGNAPAGCARGRCQPVEILPAPGGFVAGWNEAPGRDGLRSPGGRALDTAGHVRWPAPVFIPMAHGIAVAGPRGQAMALQLGVPIVLRGGARPIEVPALPRSARPYPVLARGWVDQERGPDLGVFWLLPDGVAGVAWLRCDTP